MVKRHAEVGGLDSFRARHKPMASSNEYSDYQHVTYKTRNSFLLSSWSPTGLWRKKKCASSLFLCLFVIRSVSLLWLIKFSVDTHADQSDCVPTLHSDQPQYLLTWPALRREQNADEAPERDGNLSAWNVKREIGTSLGRGTAEEWTELNRFYIIILAGSRIRKYLLHVLTSLCVTVTTPLAYRVKGAIG